MTILPQTRLMDEWSGRSDNLATDHTDNQKRKHRVGLEPTYPHYGCGVLASGRPVRVKWDWTDSNRLRPG